MEWTAEWRGVGGEGVSGAEFGCTFNALGGEVHILDGRDVLLPFLDAEVSQALVGALQRSGIVFHWKENVQKCIPLESGGVRLELSSGAAQTADAVLVAAGPPNHNTQMRLGKPRGQNPPPMYLSLKSPILSHPSNYHF